MCGADARARAADPRAAALSGAASGTLSAVCTHPLDVVRTKLAVQRRVRDAAAPVRYAGTFGTLAAVYAEEGVRGLFRGIRPAVLCNAPAAAIFFSSYSYWKAHVPYQPLVPRDVADSSLAAGAAWVVTCAALNPVYVLKTKQQTQLVRASPAAPLKYAGMISSCRVVLAEQGVRGLYAGTIAAMVGFPGAMVQMPLYERLKRPDDGTHPSAARVAVASSFSSALVGILTYPVEVVRLRLQSQGPARGHESTQYRGILDAFRKIFESEGPRAFSRGLSTGLIRTVPQTAIALSSYETLLRLSSALFETAD